MKTLVLIILTLYSNISMLSQVRTLNIFRLNTLPNIDGIADEWKTDWREIEWSDASSITFNMSARFMAGWTSDTIYFIFEVNDSTPYSKFLEGIYRNDCVNIVLSMDSSIKIFKWDPDLAIGQRNNSAVSVSYKRMLQGVRAMATGNENKYYMEWAIAFNVLNSYKWNPKSGDKIAFNTYVSDNTCDTTKGHYGLTQRKYWYPDGDMASGFKYCGYLCLIDEQLSIIAEKQKISPLLTFSKNEIKLSNQSNITLSDISGRILFKYTNTNILNIDNLPRGIYFLNINNLSSFKIFKR